MMSKIFLCGGIFAATFFIDRSNAVGVVYFSMSLLATFGLHSAIECLVETVPGPVEPISLIYRVLPGLAVLCVMVACVSFVHFNFATDAHNSMGQAVSESFKTLIALVAVRYLK